MTPTLTFGASDEDVEGPAGVLGFRLEALTNTGNRVNVWLPRFRLGADWLPLLASSPPALLVGAPLPVEHLRYFCHGYALGTYEDYGYSVFSGREMDIVLRDEWQGLDNLADARQGDILVWKENARTLQPTLVSEIARKMAAGSRLNVPGMDPEILEEVRKSLEGQFKKLHKTSAPIPATVIAPAVTATVAEIGPKVRAKLIRSVTNHSARIDFVVRSGGTTDADKTKLSSKNGAMPLNINQSLADVRKIYGIGYLPFSRRASVATGRETWERLNQEGLEAWIGMPLSEAIVRR